SNITPACPSTTETPTSRGHHPVPPALPPTPQNARPRRCFARLPDFESRHPTRHPTPADAALEIWQGRGTGHEGPSRAAEGAAKTTPPPVPASGPRPTPSPPPPQTARPRRCFARLPDFESRHPRAPPLS